MYHRIHINYTAEEGPRSVLVNTQLPELDKFINFVIPNYKLVNIYSQEHTYKQVVGFCLDNVNLQVSRVAQHHS